MPSKIPMYPFRKVEFSRSYHDVHKVKDYVGFVCPECFNPMIFRASITVNIKAIDDVEQADVSVEAIYGIKCPKCGKLNFYNEPIDPNITPMIAELNRKGYQTRYCCEGHKINQDSHAMPYITFKDVRLRSICDMYPLPGPWFLEGSDKDPVDHNNEIRYNADTKRMEVYDPRKHFIIRCDNLDIPLRERMAYLRRWVKALPEVFDGEAYYPKEEDIIEDIDLAYLDKPLDPEDITPERTHDSNDTLSINDNTDNESYNKAVKKLKKTYNPNKIFDTVEYEDDIEWQYSTVDEVKHRNDPDWNPEEEKRKRELAKEEAYKKTKKYKREQAKLHREIHNNNIENSTNPDFYNPAFESKVKYNRTKISDNVKPYYMNTTDSDNAEKRQPKKERTYSPNYKGSKYKKSKKTSKPSPVKSDRKYQKPNTNNN